MRTNAGLIKRIKFEEDARSRMIEGIYTLSKAVKSTLGARGRTVLIESESHVGGMTATKDGVTVANSIVLEDPFKDIAVRIVKEAAQKTAEIAGDGTTTSIVLTEALIKFTTEAIKSGEYNVTEVTRSLQALSDHIIKNLDDKSVDLDDEMLLNVATISANNDISLGEVISEAYKKIGVDGLVLVKDSTSRDGSTYSEFSEGIMLDRGFTSSDQVTNDKKNTVELDNPVVFITNREISSLIDIQHIFQYVISEKKSILIVGEMGPDALATFNANIRKGTFKGANIVPPGFGWSQREMMDDLALVTGATFVSEDTGSDWGLVNHKDLGKADKIIVGRGSTTIIKNDANEVAKERINSLKEQLSTCDNPNEIGVLKKRIANLTGSIATIYVGGTTKMEQKERKDRVDDAVLATKAALEGGVLPGGGVALFDQSPCVVIDSENKNSVLASDIMSKVLEAPLRQIIKNAEMDDDKIISEFGDDVFGQGFNVRTEEYGNMFEMGIIDPAKVTKTALSNAVSTANTILMSSTVIINARENEAN
jgi:chaperonin GroEL